MNPKSICTIDIKQNMISIDSKVDNPGANSIEVVGNECYSVHSLLNTPGASSIEVVGNECYGVHSSLNNPGDSSIKVVGNECYGVILSLSEQDESSAISEKSGSGFGDSVNSRSTHTTDNKRRNGADTMVHNPGAMIWRAMVCFLFRTGLMI